MDPLGFGLENYDAIGKWRTMDGKFPVDSSGTLPNGKTFTTPAEMRAVLKSQLAAVRALPDREDADLLAGPRTRDVRPPHRGRDRPASWPPTAITFQIADLRDCAEPAVPVAARRRSRQNRQSEGDSATMITRKALPRRTFLRGMGTASRAAVPRRHGARVRRASGRQSRPCAWRSSTCRTASTCATGTPSTKASSANCRAS